MAYNVRNGLQAHCLPRLQKPCKSTWAQVPASDRDALDERPGFAALARSRYYAHRFSGGGVRDSYLKEVRRITGE